MSLFNFERNMMVKKKMVLRLIVVLALSIIALQGCMGDGGFFDMKPMHKCADCDDELLMTGSTKDREICPVTGEPHRWQRNLD
jgi:hypothetical protein